MDTKVGRFEISLIKNMGVTALQVRTDIGSETYISGDVLIPREDETLIECSIKATAQAIENLLATQEGLGNE